MDLWRGPLASVAARALRDQNDYAVAFREYLLDLNPKRGLGELHEMLEETKYLSVAMVGGTS